MNNYYKGGDVKVLTKLPILLGMLMGGWVGYLGAGLGGAVLGGVIGGLIITVFICFLSGVVLPSLVTATIVVGLFWAVQSLWKVG